MSDPGRVITAMVTPFTANGEVDYDQAQKLAEALLDSGSDGVVVVGTTGESPTLSHQEDIKLFKAVHEAIGKRGYVIAGTGSNNTSEALMKTAEAEKIGVDACLLVVPYYNKPNQDGLYQHFKTIAESTNLPCILYNVPARTVVGLTPETVIRLSHIENIIGLKDAGGNLVQAAKVIERTDDSFLVYSGNDDDTLPLLSIGGYGVISVASHLVGNQIQAMINEFLKGNINQAAGIHRSLLPLFNTMFVLANPIPVKHALNYVGFNVGIPRLPLTPPDDQSASAIEEIVSQYKIDLLVN